MKISIYIFFSAWISALSAQTTIVQGTVKDKQNPTILLDSVYVRGVEKITHQLLFEDNTDPNGFYQSEIITDAAEDDDFLPGKFQLFQNYPNPFNPSTKINFYTSEANNFGLGVYNILGEEIIYAGFADLLPGYHTFEVSGLGAAGVYFYKVFTGGFSETRKMVQLDGTNTTPTITKLSSYSNQMKKATNNIEMRIYASKSGYHTDSIDVSYPEGSTNTQDFLLNKNTYDFNATINLYKTLKGQTVTDLDSVFVQWPDGTVDGYPNNNGTVSINKELSTLNADTTAQLFHKHPEKYLKWMVGHKVSSKPEWLFQNETPTSTSTMPLNVVKQEGTVEVYLVPKFANYGPNNTTPMDMESATVNNFYNRNGAFVSGFRPSPAGYDTTNVLQFTINYDTGEPIAQNQLDRVYNELNKFLTATSWPHKKLLAYKYNTIDSFSDPLWQSIINPPRNEDNYTYTTFRNAGPGNAITIATDGTKRIKNSYSMYNIHSSDGQMQEEIFDSFLNTNIDDNQYFLMSNTLNAPYTDLAHTLIGISYIFKAGTQYSQ